MEGPTRGSRTSGPNIILTTMVPIFAIRMGTSFAFAATGANDSTSAFTYKVPESGLTGLHPIAVMLNLFQHLPLTKRLAAEWTLKVQGDGVHYFAARDASRAALNSAVGYQFGQASLSASWRPMA